MKQLLIGSIGALTETSELQRQCYNQALDEFNTGLYWNVATYCALLQQPGGFNRLQDNGISPSRAHQIHERKQALFAQACDGQIVPRKGMVELIAECHKQGIAIGFITTTTKQTLDGIIAGLSAYIDFSEFALITCADDVGAAKPAPDIYHYALSVMPYGVHDTLAIEDTLANKAAAESAGLSCLFTPGDYANCLAEDAGVADASFEACLTQFKDAA